VKDCESVPPARVLNPITAMEPPSGAKPFPVDVALMPEPTTQGASVVSKLPFVKMSARAAGMLPSSIIEASKQFLKNFITEISYFKNYADAKRLEDRRDVGQLFGLHASSGRYIK
jgi:hypothetical protein